MRHVLRSLVLTLAAQAATAQASAPATAPRLAASPLAVDVFTAGPAGFHVTSSLILGREEAILVDAQFTRSEAHRLAARILETGKRLTTIVSTHAHPDHVFGVEVLRQAFPDAKYVATPEVAAEIRRLAGDKVKEWKPLYGANLADEPVLPDALAANELLLDGQSIRLQALPAGESEVATVVYVPSLKTVIAGDAVFNGVHLWLAEGRPDAWLKNLDAIGRLGPVSRVIAGHKAPGRRDDASLLEANKRYIRDFQRISAAEPTLAGAMAALRKLYPNHALPVIAEIAFKAQGKH